MGHSIIRHDSYGMGKTRLWENALPGTQFARLQYFPMSATHATTGRKLNQSARNILFARANHPELCKDPNKMPEDLRQAHEENDILALTSFIARLVPNRWGKVGYAIQIIMRNDRAWAVYSYLYWLCLLFCARMFALEKYGIFTWKIILQIWIRLPSRLSIRLVFKLQEKPIVDINDIKRWTGYVQTVVHVISLRNFCTLNILPPYGDDNYGKRYIYKDYQTELDLIPENQPRYD